MNFDAPTTYAISVIFFSSNASEPVTYFVNNSEDAYAMADHAFFDFDAERSRSTPIGLGTQTDISSALIEAENHLRDEEEQGFRSISKTIVIAGDNGQNEHENGVPYLRVETLGNLFNASVYSIPIVPAGYDGTQENSTVSFYRNQLTTPIGLTYSQEGYNVSVEAGDVFPANGFEDIQSPVVQALRVAMY